MMPNKNLVVSNVQVQSTPDLKFTEGSLPVMITDFGKILEEITQETWSKKDQIAYLESLSDSTGKLAESTIKIGDLCLAYLEGIPKKDSFSTQLFPLFQVHFLWMEQAKFYLLLWRNILFEAQKANILQLENKVSNVEVEKLKKQSGIAVSEATKDLLSFLAESDASFRRKNNGKKRQVTKWLLQQNPYPVYRKQLEDLSNQSNQLLEQFKELKTVLEQTLRIKALIIESIDLCNENMSNFQLLSQKAIDVISQNASGKAGKISVILEDLEEDLQPSNQLNISLDQIEDALESLAKKIQVPVAVNGGLVQLKEVNFQRNVKQWLEEEIFQKLHELWETRDVLEITLKTTFLNIRNGLALLQNSKDGIDSAQVNMPLNQYLKKFNEIAVNQMALQQTIEQKLEESFGVFLVYNTHQNFLPFQLQSTINKFRAQQYRWLDRVLDWGKGKLEIIKKLRTSVQTEETLGTAEKIARFIQSRTVGKENDQYSNIFLSKGYIGDSFCVGREAELEHVKNLVQQWHDGFRGAIILSGQRFCGKTLFGEMVINQFFPKHTIRLTPNSRINVLSRNFNSTYDLEESLKFIRKHTLHEKVLVWIDDLELWSDFTHPLSHNVRKLSQYIDSFSGQIFFMVSMSNWTKAYLDKNFELSNKFQSEINLDKVKLKDVRDAILVRHGATHKELINSQGNEVSPKIFQKATLKIHKATGGNIGEALRNWTFSIQQYDDEKVMLQKYQNYEIPDFLNPDIAILLRTILTEKRSNEYRLRKIFGEPFQERYKSILQRLINTGLLTRHEDGWLEINEVLVNAVAQLLDRKEYIKFYFSR